MDNLNVKIEYSQQQLKRIGIHLVSLIRDRTAKGKDKDGLPFKEYSQRPFTIPYANATKAAIKQLVKEKKAMIFTDANNVKKAIIFNGYLDYKKLVYKDTSYDGTVNLIMTGRMLANFGVINVSGNKIVLGFNDTQMAERAKANIRLGRDFLGLSPEDKRDPHFQDLLASGFTLQI